MIVNDGVLPLLFGIVCFGGFLNCRRRPDRSRSWNFINHVRLARGSDTRLSIKSPHISVTSNGNSAFSTFWSHGFSFCKHTQTCLQFREDHPDWTTLPGAFLEVCNPKWKFGYIRTLRKRIWNTLFTHAEIPTLYFSNFYILINRLTGRAISTWIWENVSSKTTTCVWWQQKLESRGKWWRTHTEHSLSFPLFSLPFSFLSLYYLSLSVCTLTTNNHSPHVCLSFCCNISCSHRHYHFTTLVGIRLITQAQAFKMVVSRRLQVGGCMVAKFAAVGLLV